MFPGSYIIGRSANNLPVWIDVSDCPVDIRYLVGEGFGNHSHRAGFDRFEDAFAHACSIVGR